MHYCKEISKISMHFHNKSLIIAMAAISAIACSKVEDKINQEINKEAKAIEFGSAFASASGEKPGFSQAGLFIGEPVSIDNAILKIDADGKVTSETKIYWADGQTKSSDFLAYSPYDANYKTKGTVEFNVKSDQSTEAGIAESDLCIATTSASPADESVSLEFKHVASRLMIYLDNQTGKEISGVTFKGAKTGISLDLSTGNTSAITGSEADVKAYFDSENGCYTAVLPAQTCVIDIKVKLSDNTIVNCSAKQVNLLAGKYYDNSKTPVKLEKGGSQEEEEEGNDDLADNTISGVYTIKDGVSSKVLVMSNGVQMCAGKRSSITNFSLTDSNSPAFIYCKLNATTFTKGANVSGTIASYGNSSLPSGSVNFKVVKVSGSNCWLRSEDGKTGIVINQ